MKIIAPSEPLTRITDLLSNNKFVAYLADQDAVDVMCREAVGAVYALEHMGLPFDRTTDGT